LSEKTFLMTRTCAKALDIAKRTFARGGPATSGMSLAGDCFRLRDGGFRSGANDTHSQEQTTADQFAFANVP
jgi:hypothetical protein